MPRFTPWDEQPVEGKLLQSEDEPLAAARNCAGGCSIEPLESRLLMAATLPRPDHVVIVIEENQPYGAIIGSANAPYINTLANNGAVFTNSFGVARPSQPNYLALFSGSTQGVTDNNVHPKFTSPNLYAELAAAGKSLAIYSQGLPYEGFDGDSSGAYARKHNPVTQFTGIPGSANKPFTAFPTDYTQLPTVSLVVPDQLNDMHDGTVQQGDTWLKSNIDRYAQWAKTHNSLLVVQFDEDDGSDGNHIATVFNGPMVKTGKYAENITHYNLLRTVEDLYGLTHANASATALPITSAWGPVSLPVVNPPAAPSALTATAASSSQINLAWKDNSVDEDGFKIERSTDGVTFSALTTTAPNATSYSDLSGLPNTRYTYRVRAYNAAGSSALAGPVSATTLAGTVSGGVYEAENALISIGVSAASLNTGYTGTGYADYENPSGDWVQWTVNSATAGTFPLSFRYANGGSGTRPLSISVNGTTVGTVSFAPTGSWMTWNTSGLNAALKAGSNLIRATDTGASGPNVDNLTVGAPVPAPAQTLSALEDSYVRDGSYAATNFGSATSLVTKLSTTGFNRETVLKFDLSKVTSVSSAKLRLFGSLETTASSNIDTAAFGVANAAWSEAGITWSNRPMTTTGPLSTTTITDTTARWYEWNVTSFLQQEKAAGRSSATLVLKGMEQSSPQEIFASSEAASNVPQLVVS